MKKFLIALILLISFVQISAQRMDLYQHIDMSEFKGQDIEVVDEVLVGKIVNPERIEYVSSIEINYVDEYPLTRRLIRFHHNTRPLYVLVDDIIWDIITWDNYYDPWYYEPVYYYRYYDHKYYTYYDYRYYYDWRHRPRPIAVKPPYKPQPPRPEPRPSRVDTYKPNRQINGTERRNGSTPDRTVTTRKVETESTSRSVSSGSRSVSNSRSVSTDSRNSSSSRSVSTGSSNRSVSGSSSSRSTNTSSRSTNSSSSRSVSNGSSSSRSTSTSSSSSNRSVSGSSNRSVNNSSNNSRGSSNSSSRR